MSAPEFFRPARGGGTWWEQTAVGKLYVWKARHSPITDFPEAPGLCCLDQPDVQTVHCGWLPLQTDRRGNRRKHDRTF